MLNVFSSELFVGQYISDLLEAYATITFGTVILLVLQIIIASKAGQFDLTSVAFKSPPPKQ